jgi:hypothetical protein
MLCPQRSARLTVWGNALLRGHTSPDVAAASICCDDAVHRVEGDDAAPLALTMAFGAWRRAGVTGLRLSLPVAGDPAGLPARPDLLAAAVDAHGAAVAWRGEREAVLAYVPETAGRGVLWRRFDLTGSVCAPPAGSLAEHDRELRSALREVTQALGDLDVASWRAGVGDALTLLRDAPAEGLAPGYPDRARAVAGQARRLRSVVALALEDDGGAVHTHAMSGRRRALAALDRAARYAEMAACNAILEPQPGAVR